MPFHERDHAVLQLAVRVVLTDGQGSRSFLFVVVRRGGALLREDGGESGYAQAQEKKDESDHMATMARHASRVNESPFSKGVVTQKLF